jgi:DNA-binding FadR family transcriptional regulator
MNARKRIIAVLLNCMAAGERMPTYLEIALRAEVSTSTAHEYIARMKRDGTLAVRYSCINEIRLSADDARELLA